MTCLTGRQPVTSLAWWVTTQSDCIRECFMLCVWECGRNKVTYSRRFPLLESFFLLRAKCFCHSKSNRVVFPLIHIQLTVIWDPLTHYKHFYASVCNLYKIVACTSGVKSHCACVSVTQVLVSLQQYFSRYHIPLQQQMLHCCCKREVSLLY